LLYFDAREVPRREHGSWGRQQAAGSWQKSDDRGQNRSDAVRRRHGDAERKARRRKRTEGETGGSGQIAAGRKELRTRQ